MPETSESKNDDGQRIIDGLDEVITWARGYGTARFVSPRRPSCEMTRRQYEMERILQKQEEDAPRLIPRRPDRR